MSIQPIAAPRLYQRIAEEIGRLIDAGTFRPGDRLPAERELARSLAVSRSSLREALGALEMAGRIVIRVGSGAYVAPARAPRAGRPGRAGPAGEISPFDVLRTRRLVEAEAAALAARHATPAQVKAMAGAFERLAADMRAGIVQSAADRAFHLAIAQASGNTALALVIERLWAESAQPLSTRMEELFVTRGRRRDNIGEHRAVLEAIRAGDAAGARGAMRRHLANAERQRLAQLRGGEAQGTGRGRREAAR
ncbi:MAG: FadR family transcriptional regulator [Burkholderiales bacterium]|nr:FadR family transcriptional regulator [Burkholderiales bacterium]